MREEHGLPAPTLASVAIPNNKILSRIFCDGFNPKKFNVFNLSEFEKERDHETRLRKARELIDSVGGVGILKPPNGTRGISCKRVFNAEQFVEYVEANSLFIRVVNEHFAEAISYDRFVSDFVTARVVLCFQSMSAHQALKL